MTLQLAFALLALALGASGLGQKFLEEPVDVVAVVGERVELPCRVHNKVGTLQWTKDDFGLGADRNLAGFSRYRMLGRDETTWNLEIANVSLEDDGRFQCQVGATDVADPIRSRYAVLSVLSAPQPPVITAGPRLVLTKGRAAMLQCISKGGKPASTIRWLKNGKEVVDGVETKAEAMEDGKKMATVSSITFRVERSLSGAVLECEATSPVEAEPRLVSTQLEVEFAPIVRLEVDKEAIYEGDTVRVSCGSEASPPSLEYQWRLDGKEMEDARGASELVLEVDRNLHKKKVSCFARNKVGQTSEDFILDVKYSPVFVRSPQDVIGDTGDKISLECQVDSNPPPHYLWVKNDLSSDVVGEGPNLSLILTAETAGSYTCQASVLGFSDISRTASVDVRGPPRILPGKETQWGNPSETVQVICEAESVPQADSVTWSYQGVVLRPGSPLYSMVETRRGKTIRSSLVIKRSDSRHFGEYGCTVNNKVGEASTVIHLKPVDALPLLIIIAAVIGGLLLTVAVIVIVLTCRRAAKSTAADCEWPKSSEKSSGGLQPDGVSNTSSDLKADTRTTSSLSAQDDLDGSDSLPEYHANYIKSQPDLRAGNYTSNQVYGSSYKQEPGWHGYGNYEQYNNRGYTVSPPAADRQAGQSPNYVGYGRQYGSENNLLGGGGGQAKYSNNYSNPYVMNSTVSPGSDYSQYNGSNEHAYGNIPPGAAGFGGGRYGGGVARSSGRYNAVAQSLHVVEAGETAEADLNESSIGTHV